MYTSRLLTAIKRTISLLPTKKKLIYVKFSIFSNWQHCLPDDNIEIIDNKIIFYTVINLH